MEDEVKHLSNVYSQKVQISMCMRGISKEIYLLRRGTEQFHAKWVHAPIFVSLNWQLCRLRSPLTDPVVLTLLLPTSTDAVSRLHRAGDQANKLSILQVH